MKIGFSPKTKDDWRLLLRLAKCIRLADRDSIRHAVQVMETRHQDNEFIKATQLCGEHRNRGVGG